jgi:hypothetical protein
LGPTYPPLPPELVEFAHGGRSLLVGTCNKALEPECVRAMGVRVWPSACQLTVIIPVATGAVTIANLRENGRLALTVSSIPTHKTIQVKGRVREIREGNEADHQFALAYREQFAVEVGWAGLSQAISMRLSVWPCFAVDLEIDVCYEQTPGPVAGEKMPLASERA